MTYKRAIRAGVRKREKGVNVPNGAKLPKRIIYTLFLFFLAASLVSIASGEENGRLVRMENVAQGIRYYHYRYDDYPLSLHMLRVNWHEKTIEPSAVLGDKHVLGLKCVSQQAEEANEKTRIMIAAVNGDFYKGAPSNPQWEGIPVGLLMIDKKIISAPTSGKSSGSSFIIGENNRPDVDNITITGILIDSDSRRLGIDGINRIRGDGELILYTPAMGESPPTNADGTEVILTSIKGIGNDEKPNCYPGQCSAIVEDIRIGSGGTAIPPDGVVLSGTGLKGKALEKLENGTKILFRFDISGGSKMIMTAIGGSPVLVNNYRNIITSKEKKRYSRTAIGYNDEEIIVVTVDGEQPGWSRGVSLYELGKIMERMHCKKAINLGGSESTTMWIRGRIVNKPSEGEEYPVANAFAFYSSAITGFDPYYINVYPPELSILPDEEINLQSQFRIIIQDKYYNSVGFRSNDVDWETSPNVGSISENGVFTSAGQEAEGFIKVSYGSLETKVKVHVCREPQIFQISPTYVSLFEGETQEFPFKYILLDNNGNELIGDYYRHLTYKVTPPTLGDINDQGIFSAGPNPGSGYLVATIRGVSAKVKVNITHSTSPQSSPSGSYSQNQSASEPEPATLPVPETERARELEIINQALEDVPIILAEYNDEETLEDYSYNVKLSKNVITVNAVYYIDRDTEFANLGNRLSYIDKRLMQKNGFTITDMYKIFVLMDCLSINFSLLKVLPDRVNMINVTLYYKVNNYVLGNDGEYKKVGVRKIIGVSTSMSKDKLLNINWTNIMEEGESLLERGRIRQAVNLLSRFLNARFL